MSSYLDFHYCTYAGDSNKTKFFEKIIKEIGNNYYLDGVLLREELIERENDGCSIIAEGLAMPHIVSSNITRSVIAVVNIPRSFIKWYQDMTIDTAIIFLVRENNDESELDEVRSIIQKLSIDKNCKLLRVMNVEEIKEMLLLGK